MLIENTIAGYETGAQAMVKNTPIVTTTTVQTMLSGTLAAIATPAVAPPIVAASQIPAPRVGPSADPAMISHAVPPTRCVCSFPTDLAPQPAPTPVTRACSA